MGGVFRFDRRELIERLIESGVGELKGIHDEFLESFAEAEERVSRVKDAIIEAVSRGSGSADDSLTFIDVLVGLSNLLGSMLFTLLMRCAEGDDALHCLAVYSEALDVITDSIRRGLMVTAMVAGGRGVKGTGLGGVEN